MISTLRADSTIQSSLVNAGVFAHPMTGQPALAFVTYGPTKLRNLRIRPQIGKNGAIRMTILQESSSVASTSSSSGPTTNKRSIESTVVVGDGKIIVLGGLIENSYESEANQLPVLGQRPGEPRDPDQPRVGGDEQDRRGEQPDVELSSPL